MKQNDIEKLRKIFDSILCLVSEGPELMSPLNVYAHVGKEATQGYNIIKQHSTGKKEG